MEEEQQNIPQALQIGVRRAWTFCTRFCRQYLSLIVRRLGACCDDVLWYERCHAEATIWQVSMLQ